MRRFAAPTALFLPGLTASSAMALPDFEAGVRGSCWVPDLSSKVQTFDPPPVETKFDAKDGLRAELTLKGPYAGAQISF